MAGANKMQFCDAPFSTQYFSSLTPPPQFNSTLNDTSQFMAMSISTPLPATIPRTLGARVQMLASCIAKQLYSCYIRNLSELHSYTWHIDRLLLLRKTVYEQTARVEVRYQIVSQVTTKISNVAKFVKTDAGDSQNDSSQSMDDVEQERTRNLQEVLKNGEQYEEYMKGFLAIMQILLHSIERLIEHLKQKRKDAKRIEKQHVKISVADDFKEIVLKALEVLCEMKGRATLVSSSDLSPPSGSPFSPSFFHVKSAMDDNNDSSTDATLAEVTKKLSAGTLNTISTIDPKYCTAIQKSKLILDSDSEEEIQVVLNNINPIIAQFLDFHFVCREPELRMEEFEIGLDGLSCNSRANENNQAESIPSSSKHMAFWTDIERIRFQNFRKLFLKTCSFSSTVQSSEWTTPSDPSTLEKGPLDMKRRKRKAETELLNCQESFKKLCSL